MATILQFPKRSGGQAGSRAIATELTSAVIVIFPGVRYEYWARGPEAGHPCFIEPVRERERK